MTITEFFNNGNALSSFAFVVLVIVGFFILTNITVKIISWITNNNSPHIIDGMIDSKQMLVFPQNPNSSGAKTIFRSNDQHDGIEFTWSVWLFIEDLTYNANQYKHIFSKGNGLNTQENGKMFPNNAPGMYINPNTNNITVFMNTFIDPYAKDTTAIDEEIVILDVPMNKWFNVMIRCQNTELTIYVNGMVSNSRQLRNVPKQNYGDVFVSANGGFSGYTSNLWYYNYALGSVEIQNLVKQGPNTTVTSGSPLTLKTNPDYLSLKWYFRNS